METHLQYGATRAMDALCTRDVGHIEKGVVGGRVKEDLRGMQPQRGSEGICWMGAVGEAPAEGSALTDSGL